MNDLEYTNFVKGLECDYEAVLQSMTEEKLEHLYCLTHNLIDLCETGDAIKKSIYYGKELKLYDENAKCGYDFTEVLKRLTISQLRLIHGVLGALLEQGEILKTLHLHIFDNVDLDYVNIHEELGDADFFNTMTIDECNFTAAGIRSNNVSKLQKRYKSGKFSQEEAINRDLEVERASLEAGHGI